MVTILTPGSSRVEVGSESNLLQWSNESSGQISFEVMFKLKDETVWNTAGKIESAESSYDLNDLYEIATAHYTSIDLIKLSYKLRVYYNDDVTDESNIYVIIFSGAAVNYINIAEPDGVSKYPLFEYVNNPDVNSLKIRVNNDILSAPLVESDSILASRAMIRVGPNNVRALMRSYVDISNDVTYNNFQRYGYKEGYYLIPQYEQYQYATYYTYYSYDTVGYSSYQRYYSYYSYYSYSYTDTMSYGSRYSYYYYYVWSTSIRVDQYRYYTYFNGTYTYTKNSRAQYSIKGYYLTGAYYYTWGRGYNSSRRYTYYYPQNYPVRAAIYYLSGYYYYYRSYANYTSIRYYAGSYTYTGYYKTSSSQITSYSYKYYTRYGSRTTQEYASDGYEYSSYNYTAYANDGLSELTGYTYGYLDKSYYESYMYKYMYT